MFLEQFNFYIVYPQYLNQPWASFAETRSKALPTPVKSSSGKIDKTAEATQVQNAKPKDKPYKLFDGGGLFLQVTPAGGKHWKIKYRRNDGKEGMLSFGSFPDVTLEQARKKRDEARTQKATGLDPRQVKQAEKLESMEQARNTFEAIAAKCCDQIHQQECLDICPAGYGCKRHGDDPAWLSDHSSYPA